MKISKLNFAAFLVFAFALGVFAAYLRMDSGEALAPLASAPSGARFEEPPDSVPILGIWEVEDSPGYIDAYPVVRVGSTYYADMPEGTPTMPIQHSQPTYWYSLP